MQNFQKSTVIFSAAIIALAVIALWQQQQINQIRNTQGVSTPNTKSAQVPAFNQAQAIKESLMAPRTVSGTVVSATSNQVVIKTSPVNLSALATFDFKKSQTLPASDKTLTINIPSGTAVSGKPVVGGAVTVQTKESVYGGGTLTAGSIVVPVAPTKPVALPPAK